MLLFFKIEKGNAFHQSSGSIMIRETPFIIEINKDTLDCFSGWNQKFISYWCSWLLWSAFECIDLVSCYNAWSSMHHWWKWQCWSACGKKLNLIKDNPWMASILSLFADVMRTHVSRPWCWFRRHGITLWYSWGWNAVITNGTLELQVPIHSDAIKMAINESLSWIGCFTIDQEKKSLILIISQFTLQTYPKWILVLETPNNCVYNQYGWDSWWTI